MYTETICNVPTKVFFLSGDFENEMPAVNFREERIRHQIWSNDQIRLKLEKLKQKNTKKKKTYQSFEMTNVSALPWGVSLLHISPRTWRPNRAPLLHQPAQTLEEAMEMEKQKEPKRQAPSPEPFWHLPFLGRDCFHHKQDGNKMTVLVVTSHDIETRQHH